MIARWGYSRALESWQTIDEISGTDGWSNQTNANAWTVKMATYFQTNDPFKHPTNGSQGGYWPAGNAANSWSNTENYGDQTVAGWASLVTQEWNGAAKPAMSGEAGGGSCNTATLFTTMSNGQCMNPMFWQYNQGLSGSLGPFPAFANFVNSINFAALTNLSKAAVTVTGATAYGIKSDQLVFGWTTGTISGKSFSVTGLANGGYSLEWWDCTAGTRLSTSAVSVTTGSLTTTVPATAQTEMAFKLISFNAGRCADLPARDAF